MSGSTLEGFTSHLQQSTGQRNPVDPDTVFQQGGQSVAAPTAAVTERQLLAPKLPIIFGEKIRICANIMRILPSKTLTVKWKNRAATTN